MIPRILKSEPNPDETNISSDWQKRNASGVGPKPSVRPQHEVVWGLRYRSGYHQGIRQ